MHQSFLTRRESAQVQAHGVDRSERSRFRCVGTHRISSSTPGGGTMRRAETTDMQRAAFLFCVLLLVSCARGGVSSPVPGISDTAQRLRLHRLTATFTTIFSFKGSDGKEPDASLMKSSGTLYGTTYAGGTHDNGTVYKITHFRHPERSLQLQRWSGRRVAARESSRRRRLVLRNDGQRRRSGRRGRRLRYRRIGHRNHRSPFHRESRRRESVFTADRVERHAVRHDRRRRHRIRPERSST